MSTLGHKPTWVEKAPKHWELTRFRYLGEFVGGGTPSKSNIEFWDGEIPWVSPKDMKCAVISDSEDHITESGLKNSPCQLVPPEALLMVVRSGILRNKLPVALNRVPVTLNQDMRALIANPRVSTRYLHYFVQGCEAELLNHWCKDGSTVESIEHDLLAGTWLALPSSNEQQRIAAFLDEQTAKIDRLVGLRRRQMDLLREQRVALIQQAVTRGLNPNAPMKDSGLPWLGEIPQHWEVVHLKRLLSLVEYGISERVDIEGRFICLRMGDLNSGEISYDGVAYVDSVEEGLLLQEGDLLFNRTNSLDQVGKVAIFRGHPDMPVTFASYLVRLRAGCDADPEYLNYLLNSKPILVWARSEAIPAIGQANLNPTRYCLLRVVKPPIEEQRAIARYCDTISQRTEELLSAYARQLTLLAEYRAALVHEVVTGQRQVGEATLAASAEGT